MNLTRNLSSVFLTLVLFFLYGPILYLIVFSFNDAKAVAVWGGFSFRWYQEMANNQQLLRSAVASLKIAAFVAIGSVVIGTLAGYVMARYRHFPGSGLFKGMMIAPMIMPEVITGMSLLLLFVVMQGFTGWPSDRGFLTVSIAHMTFASCFVAVVVRAKLASSDPSLEEAALDLGATPLAVLCDITLPNISSAMFAGGLLAFTMSIDNVVISSFTTGPGTTTLPLYIYSRVKLGVAPDINALATLMIMTVFFVSLAASIISARRNYQPAE